MDDITVSSPLLYPNIDLPTDSKSNLSLHVHHKSQVVIEHPVIADNSVDSAFKTISVHHGRTIWSDCQIKTQNEAETSNYEIKTTGIFLIDLELIDKLSGDTLVRFEERFSLRPKWDVFISGQKAGTFRLTSWLGSIACELVTQSGQVYNVSGNWLGTKYEITRNSTLIAKAQRSWREHIVQYVDEQELLMILPIIAALGKALVKTRKSI